MDVATPIIARQFRSRPDRRKNLSAILIVENESDVSVPIKRILTKSQIKNPIKVAEDNERAMTYLRAQLAAGGPLPFLVVLGLKRAQVGGLELLSWIRSQSLLKHMRVILFSAWRLSGNPPAPVAECGDISPEAIPEAEEVSSVYGLANRMFSVEEYDRYFPSIPWRAEKPDQSVSDVQQDGRSPILSLR